MPDREHGFAAVIGIGPEAGQTFHARAQCGGISLGRNAQTECRLRVVPRRSHGHEPVPVFGHDDHLAGRAEPGGVADDAVDFRRADLQHGEPAILSIGQHRHSDESGGQGVGSVEIEIGLLEPEGEAGGLRRATQRGAGHGRLVDLHAEIRTARGGKHNTTVGIDKVNVIGADRLCRAA